MFAVIALHKCGIERAHIFELLKPLNIMRVFVYRTVKLFLDTGEVRDRKRSGRFCVVHLLEVINAVKPRINRNLVLKQTKNYGLGNGYCSENHESHC